MPLVTMNTWREKQKCMSRFHITMDTMTMNMLHKISSMLKMSTITKTTTIQMLLNHIERVKPKKGQKSQKFSTLLHSPNPNKK